MTISPWTTATVVTFWFAASLGLGAAGAFETPPGGYPWAVLAAILLPLVVYALDGRKVAGPLFGGIRSLSLPTLVALQVWRVGGLFFLIEWGRGHLPAGFALPAGLGDIAIGLTAPLVAARVARKPGDARRLLVGWSLAGLADLVLAVTAGVTHSRTPLGILAGALSSDRIARYPLSIVPTFLVPLAVILHIRALHLATVSSGTTRPLRSSRAAHPAPGTT